jgi:hypothetical protein
MLTLQTPENEQSSLFFITRKSENHVSRRSIHFSLKKGIIEISSTFVLGMWSAPHHAVGCKCIHSLWVKLTTNKIEVEGCAMLELFNTAIARVPAAGPLNTGCAGLLFSTDGIF